MIVNTLFLYIDSYKGRKRKAAEKDGTINRIKRREGKEGIKISFGRCERQRNRSRRETK